MISYIENKLSRAILHTKKGVIEDLLSTGAEVDIPDSFGKTALHAACQAGDEEIARMILGKTSNIFIKDLRFGLKRIVLS